jgi:GT2 family glycosyltransferase
MIVDSMFVDFGVVAAGKLILVGWTVADGDPVKIRIESARGGQIGEAEVERCIRFDRADVAEMYGREAIDVGYVIGVAIAPFAGLALFDSTVTLTVLGADDAVVHTQPFTLDRLAVGPGGVANGQRWPIDLMIAGTLFAADVARALQWALGGGVASESDHVFLDSWAHVGEGMIVSGWIENAAVASLVLLTDTLEAACTGGDLATFDRPDVSDAMRRKGTAAHTANHGFLTTMPLVDRATRRVTVLVDGGNMVTSLGTLVLTDERLDSVENALNNFSAHFGGGALPSPAVMLRHARPLLTAQPIRAMTHEVVRVVDRDAPPRLSVIVPLYGRPFLLRAILANQAAYPDGTEFIYVSDDPRHHLFIRNYLADRRALIDRPTTLVVNGGNYGFSAANTIGVGVARAPLLLFQNSDVWVEDGGAFGIAASEIAAGQFGIVGFRLLYEDGTLQHDGMILQRGRHVHDLYAAEHPGKGLPPLPIAPGEPVAIAVPAVTGAAMMMTRDWYDALGGFDPGYVRGDFEDADLCMRSVAKGRPVGLFRTAGLRHLERQSLVLSGGEALRSAITYLNCIRFNARWQQDLAA